MPKDPGLLGYIARVLSDVPSQQIVLTPLVALLDTLFDVGGSRGTIALVGMATVLAKRDIAKHWIDLQPRGLRAAKRYGLSRQD